MISKMCTLAPQMEFFQTCRRPLPCGHPCGGIPSENSCAPCLVEGCQPHYGDGCCPVCADPWASNAVIQLDCGHIFHHACIKQMLQNRWHGSRITFGFMTCPLCKSSISHPDLYEIMSQLIHLYDQIKSKALTRLQHDGLFNSSDVTDPSGNISRTPLDFAYGQIRLLHVFKMSAALLWRRRALSRIRGGSGSVRFGLPSMF